MRIKIPKVKKRAFHHEGETVMQHNWSARKGIIIVLILLFFGKVFIIKTAKMKKKKGKCTVLERQQRQ